MQKRQVRHLSEQQDLQTQLGVGSRLLTVFPEVQMKRGSHRTGRKSEDVGESCVRAASRRSKKRGGGGRKNKSKQGEISMRSEAGQTSMTRPPGRMMAMMMSAARKIRSEGEAKTAKANQGKHVNEALQGKKNLAGEGGRKTGRRIDVMNSTVVMDEQSAGWSGTVAETTLNSQAPFTMENGAGMRRQRRTCDGVGCNLTGKKGASVKVLDGQGVETGCGQEHAVGVRPASEDTAGRAPRSRGENLDGQRRMM